MPDDLFTTIERHDLVGLRMLLARGADPNVLQAHWPGLRPLHAAVHALDDGGSVEAITLLLERGAEVDGWDAARATTPLLAAIADRQQVAVELLLKAGAEPNVRNSEGDSPLRLCAATGDTGATALLLGAGAGRTINEWGGLQGYTALGLAASRLDLMMMTLLLDAGADPSAQDEDGKVARERLPVRDQYNSASWDVGAALLGSPRAR